MVEKKTATTLTDEEVSELRGTFQMLDANRDGYPTARDICNAMLSLGEKPTELALDCIFAAANVKKHGLMDFEEFLSLTSMSKSVIQEEEQLKQTFKAFDPDNTGTIFEAGLGHVLNSLNQDWNHEELSNMIQSADQDGDGVVDYDEFKSFMAK